MKNRKFPIEVGQEVVLSPTGNYVRMYGGKIRKGRITKIARKYFYVDNGAWGPARFELETFKCDDRDNNAGWEIWPTEAAYNRAKELQEKLEVIRNFFQHRYLADTVAPEVIDQVYELITEEDQNAFQDQ